MSIFAIISKTFLDNTFLSVILLPSKTFVLSHRDRWTARLHRHADSLFQKECML